ncbi:ABC transporter permease [Dictyobacter kobayashii]|uniref:Uncharacterized protein n=1 Tax=Dictyobacter kobayashii TaxID=2014872 RepID=A0A402AI20_9CHLR|nr:ABC transporter permease [Dictyobacter kobayashii]GCE18684.1 hypothetical protein KDK_24840 [Dictyobacter kobayashii]
MARKTGGFVGWVGAKTSAWRERRQKPVPITVQASVPSAPDSPAPPRSLQERLDARFEDMMNEVDELNNDAYSLEEHAEYTFLSVVRFVLPFIFFLAFGYEDGLFMTGFREFSFVSFVLIMYVIGYGLEGLRTSLVYSMSFSRTEQRRRAFKQQMIFWIIMSVGCGIAQLASALVIQALGSDKAVVGNDAIALGAQVIMGKLPWIVYLAIGVRVALCAVADCVCSGFLHKKRETIEQKVAKITTRASNLGTVVQANLNAQSMIDNAQQFQQMIASQTAELKELRNQQKTVFDVVFKAGMNQVNRITEVTSTPELPPPDE